ncbi:MAG: ABC transporter permease, partial [Euryarchaeota archaeon]|nr:ABC transporter permease [Euryarchaeota archaeon]
MHRIRSELRTVRAFITVGFYVFLSRRWNLISQFLGIAVNVCVIGIFAKLVTLDADIAQYGTPRF